jgi:2-C-methyl-D-erythritol 2,4-cyclodiphosphate synthase
MLRTYNRRTMLIPELRVGQGYDLHRLEPGRPLMLGGIEVPAERGAVGHSDGDVLLHAIVDALLGAIKAGDIGRRYPDSDMRYAGVSSRVFLKGCAELLRQRGWEVVNLDATVLLQTPKIAPQAAAMEDAIAATLDIDAARVNVKAKTNEGEDAVGAGRAIACQAVALVARDGAGPSHR